MRSNLSRGDRQVAGQAARRNGGRRNKTTVAYGRATAAIRELNMDTLRVAGPFDPPPTIADIVVTHKFTRRVLGDDTGGTFAINGSFILNSIPGGNVVFDRIRILKVSVYGAAAAGSFIRVAGITGTGSPSVATSDAFSFEDFGTQGSRRPVVHFRPNFNIRSEWFTPSNNTGEFFNVTTSAGGEIIIQMTLQLRTIPQATV